MKKFKVRVNLHVHVQHEMSENSLLSTSIPKTTSKNDTSFFHFIEQEINQTSAAGQHSTARNYRTALNSLRKFCRTKDLSFHEFNLRLVSVYEQWLKQRGICLNTISCYMRSLRAVYNKAVEQGIANEQQPFRKAYTGVERTAKRGIEPESLRRLQRLSLKEGTPQFLARDLFFFSLQACGMPFVDMPYLKKTQIREGYLSYQRHKTGRQITIKVEPPMMKIIERYQNHNTEYIFPIIHTSEPNVAYRQYRTGMGYYNRLLKQLAHQCGISENLSSYAARHSWASYAYESNVTLPVISKALGHATTQTTLIYIRDINNDALDQANRQIIDMLFYKKHP